MKTRLLMSPFFILLMTVLTSCTKEVGGINLQWIVIPFAVIFIVIIGVVVFKNYKSIAEEKRLIEEMARREKMFAEEEAQRNKQAGKK